MTIFHTFLFVAVIGSCFCGNVPQFQLDTQEEVMILTQGMWRATDNDAEDIELNLQDKYKEDSDKDYDKLVKEVDDNIFKEDTVKALNDLFNVYDTKKTESRELNAFIAKILPTPPMMLLYEYLENKTLVEDPVEFASEFKRIWFDAYAYDDVDNKTSGFNHVYMGETNETDVHGFHNWVRYYNEEKDGELTYLGWKEHVTMADKMKLVTLSFEWNDAVKPASTISFGTRPEYEMAVFTLCFYVLPGNQCYVTMGSSVANVVTVEAVVNKKEYIRTAYFTVVGESDGGSTMARPHVLLSVLFSFLFLFKNFSL